MKNNNNINIILLLTILFSLTGCNMILMNPKGAIGIEEKNLIIISLSLMSIIVIPVIFITIFFALKYNVNNKNSIYKPNWSYSKNIEITCWTLPIIIITILAVITYKSTHDLDPYKPLLNEKKPINIKVISTNWKWIFIYPEYNIATINEIVVPVNIPINFKLTSSSVMNSFFIPALGSQIYTMPGMQTKLHLIANQSGSYKGFSSSYSGHGFSDMKFRFIATRNVNEFKKWIQKVKLSKLTITNTKEFTKLIQPSKNVPITYFSNVNSNIYENLILQYNHKHNFVNDKIKKTHKLY